MPSTVRVGDVFSVALHIDTRQLVGRVALDLEYSFKQLQMQSAAEGDFVRRAGVPTRFSADEPSDGKVVINLQVQDGMSPAMGAGSIATLEFEAKTRGSASFDFTRIMLYRDPDESHSIALPSQHHEIIVN